MIQEQLVGNSCYAVLGLARAIKLVSLAQRFLA
jgi:hypothetical protein